VIILDTNVLAEPMRPRSDEAVVHWLDSRSAEALCITSIDTAEL
jgi:toxin FitB